MSVTETLVERIFNLKKIPSKIFLVLIFLCSFMLFASKSVVNKLNLQTFITEYGKYAGPVFIISAAFLIVAFITSIGIWITSLRRKKELKKYVRESVLTIDISEKAVLREFFIQGKSSLDVPIDEPTVAGLFSKGILYKVSNIGHPMMEGILWASAVSTEAKKYLTNELLELPREPTEQEKQTVIQSRPSWATSIQYRNDRRSGQYSW